MKVKGVLNTGGTKDFEVSYEGNTYLCRRAGQKFTWRGHKATMKELKELIKEAADNPGAPDEEEAERVPTAERKVWDEVSPEAWLISMWDKVEDKKMVMQSLDANGWLNEAGTEPDFARAERDIENYGTFRAEKATPVVYEAAASAPIRRSWKAPEGKTPWNC